MNPATDNEVMQLLLYYFRSNTRFLNMYDHLRGEVVNLKERLDEVERKQALPTR